MSVEGVTPSETTAPAQPSPAAPSTPAPELPSGAAPAQDGGAAPEQAQQQTETPAQPAPAPQAQEGRAQQRFSDLSRQRNQAQQEAAYWRGRFEAVAEGIKPQAQPQAQPAPVAEDRPPNPADYQGGEFDVRYGADLAKYEIRKEMRAEAEAESKRKAEAERTAADERAFAEGRQRWESVCNQARAAGDGFENAEVVLTSVHVPRSTMDLITTSANPVHVAEVLGRRPNDMRNLLAMSERDQMRAIAGLDAQISINLQRAQAAPAPTPAPQPAPQPSPAAIPTAPQAGSPLPFSAANASPSDVDARLAQLRGQTGQPSGWSGTSLRI